MCPYTGGQTTSILIVASAIKKNIWSVLHGGIGMPHSCEVVLVKKLELEATELNLKNNNKKVHTPALVYK
jgi:hypothetical protein